MARVILGVTGGIAAYKACELLRLFVRAGDEVTPIPTPGAEGFVSAATFEALANRRVPDEPYPHLEQADLLVVAPLSANTMAKLALGLADNVLTALALSYRGPIVVAPAMNTRMWEHPATRANLQVLQSRGVTIVGPETGSLAEGELGTGRMSEPQVIYKRCRELLAPSGSFAGRRVVVTAGGTREPLDSVRFVGNRSSGRMGVALAREAARRGADVTLLAAHVTATIPPDVRVVEVGTAADLARETLARADADVIVMVAAVADYRPVNAQAAKRKKDGDVWTITLEPTQDVLAELGRRRRDGQVLVGFAADEGEAGLAEARAKRVHKSVNLIVFNDVSRDDIGFDSEENEVTVIGEAGERHIAKRSKQECAAAILDEVAALLKGG
jgi:phosphopantothenoylcysteine decarboxylase / phosphopantothenate---cysteine ligase